MIDISCKAALNSLYPNNTVTQLPLINMIVYQPQALNSRRIIV